MKTWPALRAEVPEQAPARALPFSLIRRHGNWRDALRRRMLAAADVLAAAGALGVAALIEGAPFPGWSYALIALWLLLAKSKGLYDKDHIRIRHRALDELPRLVDWVTLSVATTALVLALAADGAISPGGAVSMWVVALLAAFVLRTAARGLWRAAVPPERALVIGNGALADAIERKLELESGHHVSLGRGFGLDGLSHDGHGPTPFVLDGFERMLRSGRIDRVVVAQHNLNEETLARVISACRSSRVKLSVTPPLQAMLGTAVDLNHLAELALIEFRTGDPSRSTMFLKRALDLSLASVALVVCAPAIVAIALAIRLDSAGPAFFRQRRAGKEGVPFTMLKFRTMVFDAEHRTREVVAVDELPEPMFKLRSDPRVTRVGRLLRRTSVDELPQLLNVVRGEMSLVGPRPEEVWLVARYSEEERFRLEMRPGMTGPMQVHGRGELSFRERLAVEREYVENFSLGKDLRILLQTLSAVVRGHGAY